MELILKYFIQEILLVLCIAILIIFFIRKTLVGVIIGKASSSRIRIVFLIMGLFVLITAFIGLHHDIYSKGKITDMDYYGFITGLTIAASSIINSFASQIHVGTKGVSIPAIPFFIPRNQIADYKILPNALVLKRKESNDIKIAISTNDVKKIESAIKQLIL